MKISLYVLNDKIQPNICGECKAHLIVNNDNINNNNNINNNKQNTIDSAFIEVSGKLLIKHDSRLNNTNIKRKNITILSSNKIQIQQLVANSVYEINFLLPKNIPGTFNGKFVKIIYLIHVQGLQNGKVMRWNMKIPLTVLYGNQINNIYEKLNIREMKTNAIEINSKLYNIANDNIESPYSSVYPWSFPYHIEDHHHHHHHQNSNNNVINNHDKNNNILQRSSSLLSSTLMSHELNSRIHDPTRQPIRKYRASPNESSSASSTTIPSLIRQPLTMNINVSQDSNGNDLHLARLSLSNSQYYTGDIIRGILNMTANEIACYRVSVALEQEEILYCDDKTQKSHSTILNEHHEYCSYINCWSFQLKIPTNTTPCFTTDIVTIKWFVRIRFVVPPQNEMKEPPKKLIAGLGITFDSAELIDYKFPIDVFASSPPTNWRHVYHTPNHLHLKVPTSYSDYLMLTEQSNINNSSCGYKHNSKTKGECYFGTENSQNQNCTCIKQQRTIVI